MNEFIDAIIRRQGEFRSASLPELVAVLAALRFELVSRALPGARALAEVIDTLRRYHELKREQARAALPGS